MDTNKDFNFEQGKVPRLVRSMNLAYPVANRHSIENKPNSYKRG